MDELFMFLYFDKHLVTVGKREQGPTWTNNMGGKVVSSGGFPMVLFLGKTDKKWPSYSLFCVFDYNLLTVGKTALSGMVARWIVPACGVGKNESYVNIRTRKPHGYFMPYSNVEIICFNTSPLLSTTRHAIHVCFAHSTSGHGSPFSCPKVCDAH